MRQMDFFRDGNRIYGTLRIPEAAGAPYPAVILSHGLGSNGDVNAYYAEELVKNGFAAITFDFRGGGPDSRSGGAMTDMSVLTEANDLNAVIDAARDMPELDRERLFLMGSSQGGFVSSYVAGQRPNDIRAMVLLYPSYVLQEGMKGAENVDITTLPETFDIGGLTVGRRYVVDAASFDIYEELAKYSGDVLLLHGDADPVVPLAFSERAVKTFPSAELKIIAGAGHGFHGGHEKQAAALTVDFLTVCAFGAE